MPPLGSIVGIPGEASINIMALHWLPCHGQALPCVGQYAPLFTVIGNANGSSQPGGVIHFHLPDLQGYFLLQRPLVDPDLASRGQSRLGSATGPHAGTIHTYEVQSHGPTATSTAGVCCRVDNSQPVDPAGNTVPWTLLARWECTCSVHGGHEISENTK